jgi:hypothetical protein
MRDHLQSQGEQGPELPQLLLLDDHPSSPLDAGWDALFGATTRILRVRADAIHLTIVVCSHVILSSQARDVWADGSSAGASPPSSHVVCADEIVSATPPRGLPAPLSHPFVRR